MAIYTLDPKDVHLLFAGVKIDGYADGSFVQVEYNADAFTAKVGADGLGGRAKNHDRSAKITINLMPNSLSNAVLFAVQELDKQTNAGALPLVLTDLSCGEVYEADAAWVMKPAGRDFSTEITAKVWVLETLELRQARIPV